MSRPLLIHNARLMTPEGMERGWLLVEGRSIARLGEGGPPDGGPAERIDAGGRILLPGFLDVHVHGAAGYETMDANPEGLRAMARFFARHGVTGFFPTTWTAPRTQIAAALQAVHGMAGAPPDGAVILGVHLEGPYLNAEKCGAQTPQEIRRADREEALSFLDSGVIRLLSLAPEFSENRWLIAECVRRGITVSAAHTAATYRQVADAVALGLSHATHTYNAMTGFSHQEPGALGAVLLLPEIFCELIADNVHVHPAAMDLLYRVKGPDRVILVTDSVRCTGLPEGEYSLGGHSVSLKEGAVRLPDGALAGSVLTMDRALRNFLAATGQPLEKVWPASSLNAARSLRLSDRKGSLEAGKDADLVLVDEEITVHLTVVEGQVVYRGEAR